MTETEKKNSLENSSTILENLIELWIDTSSKSKIIKYRKPILIITLFEVIIIVKYLLFSSAEANFLQILGTMWDSQNYVEIAKNGYPSGSENNALFAFAPIYPLFISFLNILVNNVLFSKVQSQQKNSPKLFMLILRNSGHTLSSDFASEEK